MTYKDTADDLNKKFHNTFVKYNGVPALVHHFGGEGDGLHFQLAVDEHGRNIPQNYIPGCIEPINFDAMFINNTVFKDAENPAIPAVLVQRKPRRQWKRGMCVDNTRTTCPIWPLYKSFGKNLPHWAGNLDLTLIKRLLAPKYPTWDEAKELVKSYQAVALGPMFALTISSISATKHLLASHFGFIGEVQGNTIIVKHSPALQEVRDWVSRSGMQVAVELG